MHLIFGKLAFDEKFLGHLNFNLWEKEICVDTYNSFQNNQKDVNILRYR